MSVINQMLRDLDKRQAADPALLRTPVVASSRRQHWLWWLLLLPALWLGVEIGQRESVPVKEAAVAPQGQDAGSPVVEVAQTASAEDEAAHVTAPQVTAPVVPVAANSSENTGTELAARIAAAPQNVALQPSEPAVQSIEPTAMVGQAAAEPVVTAEVVATDSGTDAYALDDTDAEFLAESALQPMTPEPAVKPQMTLTAADPQRSAQQHWRTQAQQAMLSGRLADAEAAWLQLAQLQPQQPEAFEQLAQLYLQQQDWPRLTQLLARAQQQQLDSLALQWARVQQYAGTQQWQPLLDALTPALQQQYPQQLLALEAHAAQQAGQPERALQAYQHWSQLAPQDSRAWLGLGMMQDQRGQWPEAQQAYQQALQLGGLSDASRQFIQQRFAAATGQ